MTFSIKTIEPGELLRTRIPVRFIQESTPELDKLAYIAGQIEYISTTISATISVANAWLSFPHTSKLLSPGDIVLLLDKTTFTARDFNFKVRDYILIRVLFDEKVYMFPFLVSAYTTQITEVLRFENVFRSAS